MKNLSKLTASVLLATSAAFAQVDKSALSAKSPTNGIEKLDNETVKKALGVWAKRIQATERDVILIDLSPGADDIRSSKVGGTPYLPKGKSLPLDEKGAPLRLLAQINFAEVPHLPDYPSTGILQFFIAATDHYGANFDGKFTEEQLSLQKNFRVVYFADVTSEPQKIEKYIANGEEPLPFDPAITLRMKFSQSKETINSHDETFSTVLGKSFSSMAEEIAKDSKLDEDLLDEALTEYVGENDFAHKIGGYPSFTQTDPRTSNSKLRLLLQLGTDDDTGNKLMWGDSGVAGFFIDPADLKKADFSRVLYNWDCY